MTKKNVPKIRFSGFTEPWEQHKLSEIADLTSSKRVHAKDYVESGVPFYRGKEISELKEHKPISDVLYITKEKYEEISKLYGTPKIGDLLITAVGTLGNTWVIDNLPFYFKDGNLIWFKNIKCNSQYLDYVLSSPEGQRKIYDSAIGSSQKALTMVKLNELNFMFPNEAEQEKIVDFLKKIDKLIYLYQCKLENLKKQKKGLLQKMFPKAGAKVPEIRFPEFTGDWEQRKFLDITFLAGEKNKKNLPYESYSVSNEKGFIPQNEQFENGGTMKEADKRMYYIVKPNSFVYNPARINVGSIAYSDLKENVIVSSLYEVFQTVNDVYDRFLWHWFKTNTFQRMIEQFQEGGVRLYFYYDKLCNGSIMIPEFEEQRKIGQCLDEFDNLITLHQCKLEHLQKQKKALLQQMFI